MTFAILAAEATITLATGNWSAPSAVLPVLLYCDADALSAFETAAAAAAASALCLTSERVDSSRVHCRNIGPSVAAECPTLEIANKHPDQATHAITDSLTPPSLQRGQGPRHT